MPGNHIFINPNHPMIQPQSTRLQETHISKLFALNSNPPVLLFFPFEERKGFDKMGCENNHDNLTAAYFDQTAVIRVEGRGLFKISPLMKQFIIRVINSKSANRILIDMSDWGCVG